MFQAIDRNYHQQLSAILFNTQKQTPKCLCACGSLANLLDLRKEREYTVYTYKCPQCNLIFDTKTDIHVTEFFESLIKR